jgi:hypothetical protein
LGYALLDGSPFSFEIGDVNAIPIVGDRISLLRGIANRDSVRDYQPLTVIRDLMPRLDGLSEFRVLGDGLVVGVNAC